MTSAARPDSGSGTVMPSAFGGLEVDDRPGRAAKERARNCAVLISPSFSPLPQIGGFGFGGFGFGGFGFGVHVASLSFFWKSAWMLAHPPHRRDVALRPHRRQQTRCRRRLR